MSISDLWSNMPIPISLGKRENNRNMIIMRKRDVLILIGAGEKWGMDDILRILTKLNLIFLWKGVSPLAIWIISCRCKIAELNGFMGILRSDNHMLK